MRTILLCVLFSLPLLEAKADIVKCDGVWTNRPCDEKVMARFGESSIAPAEEKDPDLQNKLMLVHDLEVKRFELRRTVDGLSVVEAVRSFCLHESTSVEACLQAVTDKFAWLDTQAVRAAESEQHRVRQTAKPKEPETTVVHIDRPDWWWYSRRGQGSHSGDRPGRRSSTADREHEHDRPRKDYRDEDRKEPERRRSGSTIGVPVGLPQIKAP